MAKDPYKLPEGWSRVRLGRLCKRPTYELTQSVKIGLAGPRILRIVNTHCVCGASNAKYIKTFSSDQGDILLARSTRVTSVVLLSKTPLFAKVFTPYLIPVRGRDPIIHTLRRIKYKVTSAAKLTHFSVSISEEGECETYPASSDPLRQLKTGLRCGAAEGRRYGSRWRPQGNVGKRPKHT